MGATRLLKDARHLSGLTQTELARRLRTKQPVIARWETGLRSPSYAALERALRACGFELEARLVPIDHGEDALLKEWLALSPRARLERNRRLLETERWAQRGRPVSGSSDERDPC